MSRLEVRDICKTYDGNPVVRGISFAADAGAILAICGENGAGKSTVMKVLSGAVLPDQGEILLDGIRADIRRPSDAMALGIRTVYQELSLLPHLSVAENLLLGRTPTRLGFAVDWAATHAIASGVLDRCGFDFIATDTLVRDLSVAQQQLVEIAKALIADPRILILDEPTAVLSASETKKLFETVRRLAQDGCTILYISHRLEEIFEIADAVAVLKDGTSVLYAATDDITEAELIEAMVGRPLDAIFPARDRVAGRPILEVTGLCRKGAFAGVDLTVKAGEIVGMFGLVGSGRTEVAKAIFGAEPYDSGEVRIEGSLVTIANPQHAVRLGIGLITEDRKGDGLALEASVLDNATLASFERFSNFGVLRSAQRRSAIDQIVADLSVRPAGVDRPVRTLSGGNQQKVVLAKWMLAKGIRLFIFDEPTRGVDIATKVEIYSKIGDLAAAGAAILLISSEMPEVMGLSDRLVIMRQGELVAELLPEQYRMDTVFIHAAGIDTLAPKTEALH